MKIQFSVDDVLPRLKTLSSIVNNKNAIPILGDVLFETLPSYGLRLTASDGDMTLSLATTYIEGQEGVAFCADVKKITSALSNLSGRVVTITIEDGAKRSLFCDYGNGEFMLSTDDINEYPMAKEQDPSTMASITLSCQRLRSAIGGAIFATSNDELRPIMNGVHLDFTQDGKMVAVASDSRVLAKHEDANVDTTNVGGKWLDIPSKAARSLLSSLDKDNGDITITFNDRVATFETQGAKMQCRLIEGRFPNYNAVIPKDFTDTIATVNRDDLIAALQRVETFGEKTMCLVRFVFGDNKVTLYTQDTDMTSTAEECVACEYSPTRAPMTIGFNSQYVLKVLQNIAGDDVCVKLFDPTRAALFLPHTQDEGMDYLVLLMPVKLSNF